MAPGFTFWVFSNCYSSTRTLHHGYSSALPKTFVKTFDQRKVWTYTLFLPSVCDRNLFLPDSGVYLLGPYPTATTTYNKCGETHICVASGRRSQGQERKPLDQAEVLEAENLEKQKTTYTNRRLA